MEQRFKIAVSRMDLHGKKLKHGDPRWKAFNSSFDNYELPIHDILDVIYYGQAITTQHRDHWRTGDNYICGQHIGLDFDTEDETSTLTSLSEDPFVNRFAAFVHTTISHRDEAPRARVLFLLDKPIHQAKNYALAATALLWMFGTADPQCKDAARFFYGAPSCDFSIFSNVLPLIKVKKIISDYQEMGRRQRVEHTLVAEPADEPKIQSALQRIPPWGISYDQWVSVLMAIHAELGDAGLTLAEQWADGKPGEVEQKFRSFKTSGNGSGVVTVGSLFALAKEHGWNWL